MQWTHGWTQPDDLFHYLHQYTGTKVVVAIQGINGIESRRGKLSTMGIDYLCLESEEDSDDCWLFPLAAIKYVRHKKLYKDRAT